MLVAAAFCPHPPALIPDLAAGAVVELEPLRAACRAALDELVATAPDLVVVVGADQTRREHGQSAVGSLAPFGVDRRAGRGSGPPELPLSLTVGAWLLDLIGWNGRRTYQGVEPAATPAECAELGAALALRADRVALLVMGDGSARRTPSAPGFVDARAVTFDSSVAAALATGDSNALGVLDPVEADELLVAGRAAWQVLVGACGDDVPDAQLLYDEAPYGVAYFVAIWTHHG